jgi:hypothetical protein
MLRNTTLIKLNMGGAIIISNSKPYYKQSKTTTNNQNGISWQRQLLTRRHNIHLAKWT